LQVNTIMAEVVRLPKMSDTMTEGVIVKWNYKVGDSVKSGDILAEVETDKATMDMEVYAKGTILHLALNEGDATPVDTCGGNSCKKDHDCRSGRYEQN